MNKKSIKEEPSKAWITITVALISTASVIIAAIIGLGMPFAERLVAVYSLTVTPTPNSSPSDLIGYAVINSTTETDGTEINLVELSVDSIGVGELNLSLPSEIILGDSDVVKLSITPNSSLSKLISISIPTQNSNSLPQPFQFTDTIEIYPVMSVDLSGTGFVITANDQPQKVILSDRPTEWAWTITARDYGKQLLLIRISIPVIVEGIEQSLSTPLKNIPMEIEVKRSASRQIESLIPYFAPSIIGLIGVLLGIYANNQAKEREKKISNLEKQLTNGAIEKEQLAQEINRLKSISIWQFWRK